MKYLTNAAQRWRCVYSCKETIFYDVECNLMN